MTDRVSFNLHVLPAEQTFISAVSPAALYGRGVFTSLSIYDKKPFLWEKHWRRLLENAARLGVDLSDFEHEAVRTALSRLIFENRLQTGRARLTFFDESAGGIWKFESKNKTNLLITAADFQKTKEEFLLTISPYPVNSKSPLAGVKSCNYLENLLALEEARKRGFDEAVRVNENGEAVSASMANIFWVKDEEILTPALETGCLAGTTRELLLENFRIRQKKAGIGELFEADEIFLTSAGIGIRRARFENAGAVKSAIIPKLTEFLELQKLKN